MSLMFGAAIIVSALKVEVLEHPLADAPIVCFGYNPSRIRPRTLRVWRSVFNMSAMGLRPHAHRLV